MRALALICFFFSGAAGLVFQVIWSRLFSLVFGASSLAISAVLTAFMAGLALGSYSAGRIADRIRDPFKAYALAEAGVGIAALVLPLVVANFDGANAWAYQRFGDNYLLLALLRFGLSFAVILVPTTLMGATLPLLSRYFVASAAEHARVGLRVGTLYAVNTFGAVAGTLVGGFILLPRLGLSTTNKVAALTNLALAAVVAMAYLWRRYHPPEPTQGNPEDKDLLRELTEPKTQDAVIDPRARRLALFAFAISGASAMVYQVIWTRALALNIGSSVYSFTLVLTTFLVGLAGGAAIIGRLAQRSRDPVGWLALNHLLIALFVGVSYLLIDKLPFIYLFLVQGERIDAAAVLVRQFAMSALIMLPATLAMGGIFPLTIRVASASLDKVGSDVGRAYSINTLGAIVGSFLAGFVVIPLLHMQGGIYAAASLNLGLAAIIGAYTQWPRRRQLTLAATAAVLLALAPLLPHWNLYHLSVGLFRPSVARDALAQRGEWKEPKLVFYRDGICTTVTVEQWSETHFSLKNNGKVDASTGDDMPTQITVGLLPILIHPQTPRLQPEVALIGYASGVTAGAILQYPVKRLDVVELEPAIIDASRFFDHINHRPLDDKRVNLFTDDGRNFLAATSRRYDVIINEPSNPWITGVSNLFTEQYFRIAKSRLKKGGIFCTWAQMYELAPRRIKAIYRAFNQVYPYVYAFSATTLSSDTFLLGSDRPLTIDLRRMRRVFAIPSVGREMKRALLDTPEDLVALTLLGPQAVRAFTVGAKINTDDNALVEFAAPHDLFNHKRYDYYISRIYGYGWSYGRVATLIEGYEGSDAHARLARALLRQGRLREGRRFLAKVDSAASHFSRRVKHLGSLLDPHEGDDGEFPLTEAGPPLHAPILAPQKSPDKSKMAQEYPRVLSAWRDGKCEDAIKLIEGWSHSARESAHKDFQLLWGYLAYRCRQPRAAVHILEPLWKDRAFVKRRPVLLFFLGRAFFANADFAKSVTAYEAWIQTREKGGGKIVARAADAPVP
ncbi:MAG: fused MFS/spermidine synthase [Deltaproteobacteria bacterium]|nr:fused MFS/spermidine synthase [Deltaproteobacteria bacterium]